jgi:uncharacterized membrane protein YqaE (UPF0057 family)
MPMTETRMPPPVYHGGGADVVKILLAVVLPPIGVLLEVGVTKHFWINCLLTLLGYVPGIIHAVWVIVKMK